MIRYTNKSNFLVGIGKNKYLGANFIGLNQSFADLEERQKCLIVFGKKMRIQYR